MCFSSAELAADSRVTLVSRTAKTLVMIGLVKAQFVVVEGTSVKPSSQFQSSALGKNGFLRAENQVRRAAVGKFCYSSA
jgi:hypothetical protein